MRALRHLSMLLMGTLSISTVMSAQPNYPKAPSDSTVVDNYFGIEVRDIYRPLEDDNSPATAAWVEAENALTRSYLDTIPYRDAMRARLTELNNYPKQGLPWLAEDGNYYFYKNDGLKNQSLLYRVKKLGNEPELFLDPNALSEDGTVALTGISMSPKGKLTAYTISRSGSDWTEIYLMDTKTKKMLPDHIEWAKFTNAEWAPDGKGFYYSAYPRPEEGKALSGVNEGHNIYYHKVGTSQDEDILIYSNPNEPLRFHGLWVPAKSGYIFLTGSGQGLGNSLMMRKANRSQDEWIEIESSQDYEMTPIDVINGKLYLKTTMGAQRGRLVAIDLKNPISVWEDILPERSEVLTGVSRLGKDKFVVSYEKDASDRLELTDLKGNKIYDIELPGYGSVGLSTSTKSPKMFYGFTSFTTPSAKYIYDPKTNKSELYLQTELKGFNPDDYVTEQVFYPSKDGTMIPMFITYKKGLKKDGSNPVYLYGYGGFNISLPPSFSANRLLWLENGGIYAQANLRGGSEYGEEWHVAGTKQNKLNVFNDFISAGEYMIKEGWTTPENLVIEGASNGGLLVGAVTNMRPDLFKVAIPRVGVMDMMRYHLFTIGWNWAPDYGTSADSKEMAEYLLGYSPINNISNDGTPYPAILVTTADHDDRVVPAHSFKYAATLQQANTGDEIKLIRIDTKAGHGAGKPISKVIDEWVDIYSFIFNNLKINEGKK